MAQPAEAISGERPLGIYPERTIDELALDVVDVANTLDQLSAISREANFRRNPYELKPTLSREKERLLLALLNKRAQLPNSGILVTLLQYPGEDFNPFSQNVIYIDFVRPIPGNPRLRTELSRVGQDAGLDSLQVLKLIGEPDEIRDIDATKYIPKAHEEMVKAQRAYRVAINEDYRDVEARQYLHYLRYHLIKAILVARNSLLPEEARKYIRVGLSGRQRSLLLSFGEDEYITRIDVTPDLLEPITDGLGFNHWFKDDGFGRYREVSDCQPKIINRLRNTQQNRSVEL
jgi:hypothetical protein